MSAFTILLKKELTDSLRDRRTLMAMLVLPMLLYPTLMAAIGFMTVAGKERLRRTELTVAVTTDDAEKYLAQQPLPAHTHYLRMEASPAEQALKDKAVRAVVSAEPGMLEKQRQGGQAVLTVLYTKRYDESAEAFDRIKAVLTQVNHDALKVRLDEKQLPESFAEPVLTQARDVDFDKNLGPLIASRILPLMLVLMLFMGALYPAIDVTAGEKERGTLETLLVAPVKPLEVMAAKYLTVAAASTLSAVANLLVMTVSFSFGMKLDNQISTQMSFGADQLLTLAVCLFPAALLVSGLTLAIASLARNFKEAQSLLTPVTLLGLLPGLAGMMPGIELNYVTALIPLFNLGLLIKAVILGAAPLGPVVVTSLVIAACAAGSLKLAANAFISEALRFGGTDSWRELFFRKP